jgi:polyisoprenoid-binding protein YceI
MTRMKSSGGPAAVAIACTIAIWPVGLAAQGPTPAARADTTGRVRLEITPTGNEARYRAREQLMGVDFPNDAVGKTNAITGALVFDRDGKIVSDESKIVVDVTGLKSDKERRDGYLQRRTLLTAQYPTVTLVPTAVRGLPWPLPASGDFAFDLVGDLTVKETTRPTVWHVTAVAKDGGFSGNATTSFTFVEMGLEKPSVRIVLSVEDTIKLEYDFTVRP